MLGVVMLNVVILSVVMLIAVAPNLTAASDQRFDKYFWTSFAIYFW
jgi:hypothetical protein